MTDLIVRENTLPATLEDLSKFVLVGRDKLQAVRAEMSAMKNLNLAKEVREQKLAEGQEIGKLVLLAEAKLGELFNQMPKATSNNNISGKPKESPQFPSAGNLGITESESESDDEEEPPPKPKPKLEVAAQMGFNKNQVADFQKLADNPDAVQKAIDDAKDNGEIVTRSNVLAEIKQAKRAEKENRQEERRVNNAAKVEELATPLDAKGLFQTIVIDPPWDWGDEGDVNQFGRAKPEYSTMPFDDIKTLPVNKIADESCHLDCVSDFV